MQDARLVRWDIGRKLANHGEAATPAINGLLTLYQSPVARIKM
jgi:hypothetical protein